VTVLAAHEVAVALEGVRVVDGLTLELVAGDWLGLIGPNGAGKTTFLRAVTGLVPYTGSLAVLGAEVASQRRRELARRVAVVPQDPVIPPEMTVLEYTVLGRTPHLGYSSSPSERDVEAARAALARLDAEAFAGRRLGSLSGGERQRAVLARAVAQEASLLLLDEPTSALDIGAQQHVLELVEALRADRELTVLSAMHDLTLAAQYADRLFLLAGGREVARGAPAAVLTEELIGEHYGASVRVVTEDGRVAVVPVRAGTPVAPGASGAEPPRAADAMDGAETAAAPGASTAGARAGEPVR
jgi:iron complex transport system ATP-binding protein